MNLDFFTKIIVVSTKLVRIFGISAYLMGTWAVFIVL